MERTRLCEYQGGLYFEGEPTREHVVGVENVKQARQWVDGPNNAAQYGQRQIVKVVLWPQTARARGFCAGRGDFIVVERGKPTVFCQVG